MHKQSGYKSVGTTNNFEAILYETTVLSFKRSLGQLKFKHGGFITNSTTKAINGALAEIGLSGLYRAKMSQKQIFIEVLEDKKIVDQFLVNS